MEIVTNNELKLNLSVFTEEKNIERDYKIVRSWTNGMLLMCTVLAVVLVILVALHVRNRWRYKHLQQYPDDATDHLRPGRRNSGPLV